MFGLRKSILFLRQFYVNPAFFFSVGGCGRTEEGGVQGIRDNFVCRGEGGRGGVLMLTFVKIFHR